jgi:ABC-type Zn uptake system ZnuABC Zn-binding protein ZnuA
MEIVNWIKDNWVDIANVIAYVIAIASIIVKLTPNTKDDAVLAKIIKFISKYIALNK